MKDIFVVMHFKIAIAEKNVDIICKYDRVWYQCKNYIINSDRTDITIQVTDVDISRERDFSILNQETRGRIPSDIELESLAIHRKIAQRMIDHSILLMHGSVVSDGKKAYMFTAPSGVGKTTRTRLFLEAVPNSFVVNGDKPFLIIKTDNVYACGTPWCGKEQLNTNTIVPLKAIFVLSRGDSTSVSLLSASEALAYLMKQIYFPGGIDAYKDIMRLINKLLEKVSVYSFQSEPTMESVMKAYQIANGS